MIKKDIISKDWQSSDEARKRFQDRIDQYKKDKVKLDNFTINENKSRKDKSIPLIISAIFFVLVDSILKAFSSFIGILPIL
jgi:hypothetical protein